MMPVLGLASVVLLWIWTVRYDCPTLYSSIVSLVLEQSCEIFASEGFLVV